MRCFPGCVFAVIFLLGGCKAPQTASRINEGNNQYAFVEKLDTLFKNSIARNELAGAVCLISEKGKIVYHQASGHCDIAQGAMEKSSLFRLKSMNKPILALAALKLISEGKINLDDPAEKYFPALKDKQVGVDRNGKIEHVSANGPITLRHLLSHSSGFGRSVNAGSLTSMYEDYEHTAIKNFHDSMEAYMKLPLIDHPGKGWYYGEGHRLMAYLTEKVTGTPDKEYLEKEIFRPLGLNQTTFSLSNGQEKELSQFYMYLDGQMKKALEDSGYTAGDDLMSSAEDYYKFCSLLLNKGYLNGKPFVNPDLIAEMSTPVVGLDGEAISWLKG